jgi:hypothetical protein
MVALAASDAVRPAGRTAHNASRSGIVLQRTTHFGARHVGQHQIQQHQVGLVLAGEVQPFLAVGRVEHLVAS